MHLCSVVEARHHGKCSPSHSRVMQISANKYPNTDALSNMKAFCTFGVTMGSLDPTHKPLYDTVTLSVAVGWVVLVDARPGPCQRAAADWYPVLRGFGRQMLAGKSPFVKCVAEYVKKLGNCVLPHEYEQKFGKAACEVIKYWSGYHFSSPNSALFPISSFFCDIIINVWHTVGMFKDHCWYQFGSNYGESKEVWGSPVVTICRIFVFISHTQMHFLEVSLSHMLCGDICMLKV